MGENAYFLASIILEIAGFIATLWIFTAKLASNGGKLEGSINNLSNEIRSINRRLDDGDGEFDKVGEKNQRIELAMATKFGDLKLWMAETFALKKDLKDHESSMSKHVDDINRHLNEQDKTAAVVKATLERK